MRSSAYLEAYTAPLKGGGTAKPAAPSASPATLPFLEAAHYYGPHRRPFDRLGLDLLAPPELVTALEDAGFSSDLTAAELREIMATLNASIDRLWEMAREKEGHIDNFNRIVSEQENHIHNFQQMVQEKENHIRNFQQMLAEKDRQLSELQNRKRADNINLRRIIAGRERTIAELERQLRSLQLILLKSSSRRWHDYRTRLRDVVSRRSGNGKNKRRS
ncbi:MAG: hypothetical protein M0Z32_00910 [Actinomycetota bacterium]|nr:hypothetical protein [Actinomycetota bacterium]MCL6093519.1 hypothetical protein [Actinomycetota bacterium]MDA8166306.1 hypothetical protein [Actinomycetota bacterium]